MTQSTQFNPLVSIVIPVYNGSNYLREAIDSALGQTYENIEIIVVNDGSTDDGATAKIAKSYGDRILYLSKENGGVATALNLGIKRMSGDYFSWLSHDDVYCPHKLHTQIEYLNENKGENIVLYSGFDFIDHTGRFLSSHCTVSIESKMFRYALITGNPIHGCTALVPKSCFDQCGLFDEALITTQDYDMWFRIAKRYSFIYIPRKLIKSRLHDEQCSRVITEHSKEKSEYFVKCLADMFKLGFVDECGEPLSIFYSRIAINLKKRGYSEASKCALDFSKKSMKENSVKSYLISVFFLLHYYGWQQWMELLLRFKVVVRFLRRKLTHAIR